MEPGTLLLLVGGILAIAGVAAPNEPGTSSPLRISGGNIALWVISEVLQAGGVALFTAGLFMPKRSLVYDAPVNAPPPPGSVVPARRGYYGRVQRSRAPQWMIVPSAPDTVAGASLVVTTF